MAQDQKTDPPCHARACAIQHCLQRNGFNEARCKKEIDALYACCHAFYRERGENASAVSCPKYSLLTLKTKQRAEGP